MSIQIEMGEVAEQAKGGTIQLEIEALINGSLRKVAVLTCINSVTGRHGASLLASFASEKFANPDAVAIRLGRSNVANENDHETEGTLRKLLDCVWNADEHNTLARNHIVDAMRALRNLMCEIESLSEKEQRGLRSLAAEVALELSNALDSNRYSEEGFAKVDGILAADDRKRSLALLAQDRAAEALALAAAESAA